MRKSVACLGALATSVLAASDGIAVNLTISPTPEQPDYAPNGPQIPANPPANQSYEYIVVGSGPGGAPVAARLALAGHSVLLVDAGGDHGRMREVEVPATSIFASERSEISWDFYTRHYADDAQARRDRKMCYRTPGGDIYSGSTPPAGSEMLGNLYPRVGALGGCAQHNALIAILPANNDWDYIKNLTGDEGWDAENMRGYYRKLEKCEYIPSDPVGAHGYSGWLTTALTPLTLVLQDLKFISIVIAAADTVGIDTSTFLGKALSAIDGLLSKLIPIGSGSLLGLVDGAATLLLNDINNNDKDRDSKTVLTQIPLFESVADYRRSSPRDWIYDIATATNADGSKKYKLDVALNTLATKVVFDQQNGTDTSAAPRAVGIEYLHGQSLYRADPRASMNGTGGVAGSVKVTREVIVSGGTFNTPQLLKLSGIGPHEELQSFGIPVVKDLPGVGTNLQDRYETGISGQADSDFALLEPCSFLMESPDECYNQWVNGIGPLKGTYTTNGIALAVFTRSSTAGPDHDLWIGGIPALFQGYYKGYSTRTINPERKNFWTWLVLKAHSRNRNGKVTLRSADPRDTPEIVFHNFNEGDDSAAAQADAQKDLQAVVEGLKWGIRAFENLTPLDGSNFTRVWPPVEESSTDADLEQWARDEVWGHHASCTAAIGADDDPMAVLDGQNRVRGVQGLRVVDASVFPKIIGTFPVLGIYMMAEKVADDILNAAK